MELNNKKITYFDKLINKLRHWLLLSSSIILITLGIVGLLLPIMPGIPFLILGLMLWYKEDARQIKNRILGLKTKITGLIAKKNKNLP